MSLFCQQKASILRILYSQRCSCQRRAQTLPANAVKKIENRRGNHGFFTLGEDYKYFEIEKNSYHKSCGHYFEVLKDESGLSLEDWRQTGQVSIHMGIIYIVYGLITETLYVLVMKVMLRAEFRKHTCYQIMIALGFYDMLAIMINSLVTGYLYLFGAVYCLYPNLIYISGSIGVSLWCGACLNCFYLVINRLIELWKPHLMPKIFGGHRIHILLAATVVYTLYFFFFTTPILFNSALHSWFFDPFINKEDAELFYNYPHTINNLTVVVVTCVLYGFLCYVLVTKFSHYTTGGISWAQKSTVLQSCVICCANLVASLIYVYMQFFPTPLSLILIGHLCWMAGHGIPVFVYLTLNRTIRYEVLAMFLPKKSLHKIESLSTHNTHQHTFEI